jgi:CubicO group peptidase (beta-lactamase class C family)
MCCLMAAICVGGRPLRAQQPSLVANGFSRTQQAVDALIRARGAPGVTIVLVRGDSVALAWATGVASLETKQPMTPDLITQVGSVTKPFTAALVLGLAGEGAVRLGAPIANIVEGLTPGVARLTLAQLLSQTSGLRDVPGGDGAHDERALLDASRALRDSDVVVPPGAAFSYTNAGLSLAGVAAQQAARVPFAQLMRDRLLVPLGMSSSTMRVSEATTHPFADGHERGSDGTMRVVRPIENNVAIWPAGYLHTSARELSRFVIAMLNQGRVGARQAIPAAVVDSMLVPHVEIPSMPRSLRYGYGMMLDDFDGHPSAWHAGSTRGHSALIRMLPTRGLGVIVLANVEARLDAIADAALTDALAAGDPRPGAGRAIRRGRTWRPATTDEIKAVEGHYDNRLTVHLRLRADTLRLIGLGPERTATPIGVANDGRLWLAVRAPNATTADTVIASPRGYLSVFLWTLPRR